MYKSKLHELCQKNGWRIPTYTCKRDGQDHNPLFKAYVVVNGVTFASRSFFKSAKSAGNDAAQVALTHFKTSSGDVSKNSEVVLPVTPEKKPTPTPTLTPATPSDQSPKLIKKHLLCNKVGVDMSIGLPVSPEAEATPTPTPAIRSDQCPPTIEEPDLYKFMESYLLFNKVRVHTSIPTTELPNGTVILPIGEDKWTVVSLETA